MRILRLLVAILAFVAVLDRALAAQRYVGGGAGVVAPSGSFGGVDHVGWEIVGDALLVPRGALGVGVNALLGETGHKSGVSGHTTLAGGTADVALWVRRSSGRVRVVLLGGVGAFRVNVDVPTFGSAATTRLAFEGGGGVLIGSGRRRVFVTVRYVNVRTSPQPTAFLPISAGVVIPL